MSSSESGFSGWDWAVFSLALTASLGTGVVAGWLQKRKKVQGDAAQEFLMGGRNLNTIAVALSTMIGAVSTNVVLGNPAEMYAHGTQLWVNHIGLAIGFFYVHMIILRVLYPLKITSIYTYIERRFKSKGLRSFTVVTTMIGTFFYMGLVSYSPSLAMQTVTGFPIWASILLLGVVCTIYSSYGGVRSVVYTDILQTVILFAGLIAMMVMASVEVGGLDDVWRIADEHGRVEWWNTDPSPLVRHTVWNVIVQGYFQALIAFGMGQPQVQRICSVPTWKKAIFSHYTVMLLMMAAYSCCNFAGVAIYAVYADCDPMATGEITKPDQIMPYFITDKLSKIHGLPGLLVAALYAGGLSSYSSQINAVCAVMWEEFFKTSNWVKNMAEERRIYVNVMICVVTGILGMIAGVVASNLGGIFQIGQTIIGTIHSPLLGLFILGMCCPYANYVGGTVGFSTSLAFNLWITVGAYAFAGPAELLPFYDDGCVVPTGLPNVTEFTTIPTYTTTDCSGGSGEDYVFPLYLVSYTLYSLFGVSITFAVGAIVSLIYKPWTTEESGEIYVHPTFFKLQLWWERRRGIVSSDSSKSTDNLVKMDKMEKMEKF